MNLTDTPTQNLETAARKIDDLFYVMNPDTSELHNFNEVGTRIWELIDGQRTVADIAAVLTQEYEVDGATVEADLLEFLTSLQGKGLIEI
jgi:pyrroloquinoline quinone biosynthesis protein D